MFVKPISDRKVPDPERGDSLPPEGRTVEPTQYWLRRIADGDVAETDPPTEATPAEKAKE